MLGSVRMGFYVFLANASAGLAAGVGAGLRQSFISFLMFGFNTKRGRFIPARPCYIFTSLNLLQKNSICRSLFL